MARLRGQPLSESPGLVLTKSTAQLQACERAGQYAAVAATSDATKNQPRSRIDESPYAERRPAGTAHDATTSSVGQLRRRRMPRFGRNCSSRLDSATCLDFALPHVTAPPVPRAAQIEISFDGWADQAYEHIERGSSELWDFQNVASDR